MSTGDGGGTGRPGIGSCVSRPAAPLRLVRGRAAVSPRVISARSSAPFLSVSQAGNQSAKVRRHSSRVSARSRFASATVKNPSALVAAATPPPRPPRAPTAGACAGSPLSKRCRNSSSVTRPARSGSSASNHASASAANSALVSFPSEFLSACANIRLASVPPGVAAPRPAPALPPAAGAEAGIWADATTAQLAASAETAARKKGFIGWGGGVRSFSGRRAAAQMQSGGRTGGRNVAGALALFAVFRGLRFPPCPTKIYPVPSCPISCDASDLPLAVCWR